MKTKTSLFVRIFAVIIIEALFLQCFYLSAYAEYPQGMKPGHTTNTVVWETSLKSATGRDEMLQLVCLNGTVNEDTYEKGRITGVSGRFELRLTDSHFRVLSANRDLFDFEMWFNLTSFKIIFDDYNYDGYVDFALGQTTSEKPGGWVYKIYTIKDGKISELRVKEQPYIFISGGGYYYKQLDKNGAGSFQTVEYEGYSPKSCVIKTYEWVCEQFIVTGEKTNQLVSDKNMDAEITDIASWPEYGISVYSTNEPKIGGYKGYEGYYVYVRGEESYYPDWESNYSVELHSIGDRLNGDIFAIHLNNSDGTSYAEPTVMTFSARKMGVIEAGPEYFYSRPPYNNYSGQMVFSGGYVTTDKNVDMLLMINGELVTDIDVFVQGYEYVPLYQINEKLGLALNQGDKVDVPWQIVDGVAYVALNSVAEAISADYGVLSAGYGNAGTVYPYDLAWIDTRTESQKLLPDQDAALKYAKEKISAAFEQYKPVATETYKSYGPEVINNSLDLIKSKIDGMEYIEKFSHFWIFKGPYTTLVDEYTGDIYFQQWAPARTWIMKIDFNKPVSFDLSYFLN